MLQRIKASVTGNVVEGKESLVIRQAGQSKVLNFTLASNNFAPEGSEQTTSFIRVSAWNQDAERLAKYLTKGKPLTVSGRLELRPYTSKKYHDGEGNAATMISAELRMEQNGFEFINGGRRQQGDASTSDSTGDATQPTAEQPVAAAPASTGGKRSRSRKSAAPAASGSVQEVAQPGGPF